MAKIELAYGRHFLPFSFDEHRFQVLIPPIFESAPLSDIEIGNALDYPVEGKPLDEILEPDDSVLIVVSDATRATGSAQIVNLLVRRIIQCGISTSNIAIIFATGIHRSVTSQERIDLLSPFIVQRVRTIDHQSDNPAELVSFGTTRRGTPVQLNKALEEFSHVVSIGGIGFHYFAGFTGGRKSICPGLGSAETIKQTHVLALDFEKGGRRDGVGTGLLTGNAVHEECEEIAAKINVSFGINAIVDSLGRVVEMFTGDWRRSHRRACDRYLETHSVKIDEKRDLVIVSSGGSPYDLNLIQAHKALDMAAHACNDRGTIVLLAQCADGLGRPDFLKWFDGRGSRELERRLRSEYEVNGQTAWALLTKTERYRTVLISDLPDEQVRKMGMVPAESIEDTIGSYEEGVQGYILPRGAAFLPVLNTQA